MQISANNVACHRGGEGRGRNDVKSSESDGRTELRNGKKWPSISSPVGGRSVREGGRERQNRRESRGRRSVDFDRRGKQRGLAGLRTVPNQTKSNRTTKISTHNTKSQSVFNRIRRRIAYGVS